MYRKPVGLCTGPMRTEIGGAFESCRGSPGIPRTTEPDGLDRGCECFFTPAGKFHAHLAKAAGGQAVASHGSAAFPPCFALAPPDADLVRVTQSMLYSLRFGRPVFPCPLPRLRSNFRTVAAHTPTSATQTSGSSSRSTAIVTTLR